MRTTDRRLTFDEDAENYRSARPAYPERVYEILAARFDLRLGTRVLEVGPGSGQATRVLLDHGAEVTAVELGERFAAQLRTELAGRPLRVVVGDFATVDVEPDAYDLGVCATAFHWLDAATAVRRFARSIRPGGGLAI